MVGAVRVRSTFLWMSDPLLDAILSYVYLADAFFSQVMSPGRCVMHRKLDAPPV